VIELLKKLKHQLAPVRDRSNVGEEGRLFFIEPEGFLPSLFWASYLSLSMYAGLYLACGNDNDAVKHSWYDHDTTKHFWREIMEKAGMRIPREMGRYNENDRLIINHELNTDLVFKLADSYVGIGDLFLDYGEDYSTQADIENVLQTHAYDDSTGGRMLSPELECVLSSLPFNVVLCGIYRQKWVWWQGGPSAGACSSTSRVWCSLN
jgi:hypothetical protein